MPEPFGKKPGSADTGPGTVSEDPARRRAGWRRLTIRFLQAILTVAVTAFILRVVGVSAAEVASLDPALWSPSWWMVALASGLLLAGYLCSGALWGVMVRELGGPRLGTLGSCRIFLLSNLGRYVPGKVWQIAGLAYLAGRSGVRPSVATAAALLGQGTALAGATLVGAVALVDAPAASGAAGRVALWLALCGVVLLSLPPVFWRVMTFAFRRSSAPLPTRLRSDATFGARWTLLYAVNWALYAGAFWTLVRGFHLQGALLEVAPAFAAAYVLGYLAVFAPAGIGVREGFLVAFLQPVLGVPALGIAIIARLWTTAVELGTAAVFALLPRPAGQSREGQDE